MAVSASDIVVKPVLAYQKPRRTTEEHDPASGASLETRDLVSSEKGAGSNQSLHSHGSGGGRGGGSRFEDAVVGSASGVGGFLKHFFKGMYVDMPLAMTEGLRSAPRLYGGEVRELQVTDWKSGMVAAGKNFADGMIGFGDLVREPVKGAKANGAAGAATGVAKGVANMAFKFSSGMWPAHRASPGNGPTYSVLVLTSTRRHSGSSRIFGTGDL